MSEESPVERVERVMHVIAGKWRPAIIYALVTQGPLRFVQLRRQIPRVTQRMLTQQLRDLERHGIVRRTFYEQIPPRVEYALTPLGRSLDPIFKRVCDWAEKNFPAVERARARYDDTRAGAREARVSSPRRTEP
ncbi:MAG TPA: helix-turn-helix domain-containing protein [Haliangiales bacterium]|nr:helix-turn-helix domain-containing protein [Haliangiales bacterium]